MDLKAMEKYGCTWPIQTLKPDAFKCQMEKFDDTKKKLMAESYTGTRDFNFQQTFEVRITEISF